ncbi:tetratricopeptide repeat protein [Pseudomonas sp. DNDY-54]|uniref:tetratricopeptide repeat protein n=1 Tax=Pseudomonas sp. DNDY-54 TaxID=2870860 RepID=UPI001CA437E6|nr:tetratricopeptide repeat protein [Pseudomonas sp. DNDY-54]
MSLVNGMLRDLEARRAAPAERQQLGSIHAVDEAGAVRRERSERLRRGLLIIAATVLVAIALVLLFDRLRAGVEPAVVPPEPVEQALPTAEVFDQTRLLDVLPQNDGRRFVLQLLLDRSVSYQRIDTAGSVSLQLKDVAFSGEARTGRIEKEGQTLSWRVEPQGRDTNVLLVGFGDRLNVADRLESMGDRAQLWLEVSLSGAEETEEESVAMPVAESAQMEAAQLPEWVTREAPPAEQVSAPARAEATPAAPVQTNPVSVAERPVPTGPKRLSIGAHQPGALASARQSLVRGDHLQAIQQLQTLHQAQPTNPEVSRWLARAYLAAGDAPALLSWLPAQLHARPFDTELRELLARGQLQAGDQAAAVATLQQHAPELQRNAGYHAVLAALYQQVGDWSASAATYRQLVALQPNQGAWQLGLAIALEQLDQPVQAGRHYRLALQGQGLDESARQFAIERAGSLGGTP